MAPIDTHVDLLIIGAGPAGLMAALSAASYGIKTRIIDKRVEKLEVGFGDGFMIRTMEILDTFGLANRVAEQGCPFTSHHSWVRDPETGNLLLDKMRPSTLRLPSHRYALALSSFKAGEIMLDRIHEISDIRVERGKLPEDLTVASDGREYPVTVTLRQVTGSTKGDIVNNIRVDDVEDVLQRSATSVSETVHAKYVIGCDGAHSWTRRQLGIPMEGDQTDVVWGVCDIVPITDFPSIRSAFNIQAQQGRVLSVPRENGLVRMYTVLASSQNDHEGKLVRSSVTEDTIREHMRKAFLPYDLDWKKCEWWAAYQIGQRLARGNTFKDRVFLAGDSVHTHSPQAGQGMNVSMGDTYNLTWKLNLVLKGLARPDILSTYHSERHRVAEDLINFDRGYASLMSGRPIEGTPQGADGPSSHLIQVIEASKAVYNNLQILYPASMLTKSSAPEIAMAKKHTDQGRLPPGLVVGMRMPSHPVRHHTTTWETHLAEKYVSNGKFKLLVFPGDISQSDKMDRYRKVGAQLSSVQSKSGKQLSTLLDVITIHTANPAAIPLLDLPEAFHPFDEERGWEYDNVYYSGPDLPGFEQGVLKEDKKSAYQAFEIDPEQGLLVVMRPDGYIAQKGVLENFKLLIEYLRGFWGHANAL